AAAIGGADDDCLDPGLRRLLDRHVGEAQIGPAARQAQLAEAGFAPPPGDAVGSLGGELIRRVADEQEIRGAQRHGAHRWLGERLTAAILGEERSEAKALGGASRATSMAPRSASRPTAPSPTTSPSAIAGSTTAPPGSSAKALTSPITNATYGEAALGSGPFVNAKLTILPDR